MPPPFDLRDEEEPYAWWGYHWQPPVPLSAVQILLTRSIDAVLMATLWMVMERRASVLVASGPPEAGKSTTLAALADFLPPGTRRVYVKGEAETFAFLQRTRPEDTYLFVNEISDHLPVYLWGPNVPRLFETLRAGYGIGATLHAETVENVITQLVEECRVPTELVARIAIVLLLEVRVQGSRVQRRVRQAQVLHLAQARVESLCLAEWLPEPDVFRHDDGAAAAALAESLGWAATAFARERERRAAFLTKLTREGVRSIPAVRAAIEGFSHAKT
jgi:hypothetical protein